LYLASNDVTQETPVTWLCTTRLLKAVCGLLQGEDIRNEPRIVTEQFYTIILISLLTNIISSSSSSWSTTAWGSNLLKSH
jgi:hypothetical protein